MTETPEQIADRIARAHIGTASYHDTARQLLKDDVLLALRNERERAIRIINDHQALDKCEDNCWTTIKAAIREDGNSDAE